MTEIMKIVEDGVEIGYSLTLANSGTVTIYHGTNGANGSTPKIGVQKASDGAYYWTADGEWLTDNQGNMIPATVSDPDGGYATPQFRVADGVWYVSYDNGNSWRQIEMADETCECIFKDVTYDSESVCFTLADGTTIVIPLINKAENYWAGKKMVINGDSIPYGSGLTDLTLEDYFNNTFMLECPSLPNLTRNYDKISKRC